MEISVWIIVVILIILIFIFSEQAREYAKSAKDKVLSWFQSEKTERLCKKKERLSPDPTADTSLIGKPTPELNDPKANSDQTYEPNESDTLRYLGYTNGVSWDEAIKVSELDPSTFINQSEYVKDVRRFSSGANFTSVTDDNTSPTFTNFIGLRRNNAIMNQVGQSSRQVPSEDETVLTREKVFRWNATS